MKDDANARAIVGGVDTHKDLHVAAVVDEYDRVFETSGSPRSEWLLIDSATSSRPDVFNDALTAAGHFCDDRFTPIALAHLTYPERDVRRGAPQSS